ncbi:MAG: Carboxypeptidase regulatory-like domain, partial [Gaiellaceae bacterium]|nr:Carboxypeptidase regulatory-like domain [Gaiellaceae bacterium]
MLGVAFVVDAPDARAGAPGTWSEVQGAALPALSAQFSGVRAADGSLFVAYGASNGDVFVSTVGSNGVRQTTARATTAASSNPRLLRGPDGTLRLLWSNGGAVQSSTAPATGVPWSSPPTTVSPSGSGAGPLGAAVAADGTIFFGQASFGGAFLHRGIDPATPNQPISPDPSGHPGIAIDGSTGAVWFGRVASSSLAVQRVDGTTGAATGGAVIAPAFAGGTATIADPGLYNPLALSGRISAPGIYATYLEQTAGQRLLLWRVGDALPVTAAVSSGSIRDPNLVPAPDGGLWIVWLDSTAGVSTLQVRQLRSDGVTLGPITKLVPPGTSGFSSQTLTAVAQADRVDVLVAGRIGAGPVLIYDQQVLAPAGVVTIAGRVTARDGRPIADAPVQACRQGAGAAGICPTTVTDRNGLFSFSGIAPGSYQLTAFAPPRGLFDRTAHVGLSTVAANQHLAGQDITMSGPLPIPAGFGIAGPGLITTVGGVPVIVRNQPVLLIFDLSNDIDRAHISYTVER